MNSKVYLCIDLKSFYASVECVERGLDPMTTNLVVADPERSTKTICLAISPSMKALGIKNRCRVFEIPEHVDYIMATPRMKKYIEYAANIYAIYLRFISKEDIHVYSIDEAFLDVTDYLEHYHMNPKQMALMLMDTISKEVGVRATCGIGTNLYLTKIALDITAKHADDFIGILDEEIYKKTLWNHQPITDFWRVGQGTAKRLESCGIMTMGEVAQADEDLLYRLFGVDAQLLIDHAWGRETVTIADIKAFRPKTNCLSSGQVLMSDYSYSEGQLIVKEMMDVMCLDLVEKGLVTESVSLMVGYSNELHLEPVRGTANLSQPTSSDLEMIPAIAALYEHIVDHTKMIRRVSLSCNQVIKEAEAGPVQMSLFDEKDKEEKEQKYHALQLALVDIKKKHGKNAILKGMNYEEGAMTRERNHQIGGHKSGEE